MTWEASGKANKFFIEHWTFDEISYTKLNTLKHISQYQVLFLRWKKAHNNLLNKITKPDSLTNKTIGYKHRIIALTNDSLNLSAICINERV